MTTQTAAPELELREVPGPSALGGGWRRALELLSVIAVNDFKNGDMFSVEVPEGKRPLDVFHHPFAYAA